MATQSVKGSGSTKNNGGTVIGGGNFDSAGPMTNGLLVKDLNVPGPYGSQVIQRTASTNPFSDADGVIKAKAGNSGVFAYQSNDNFIVLGAGSERAGKINGVSSNLLATMGSEYAGTPRFKANTITGAQKLGNPQWLYPVLPGSGRKPGLINGSGLGDVYSFTSTTDGSTAGSDKAISHTRAVPGEITYRTGAVLPKNTNLKATDAPES
jgi:hypothetical protein